MWNKRMTDNNELTPQKDETMTPIGVNSATSVTPSVVAAVEQHFRQQQKRRVVDREVLFIPPWETKIGQLQQVVRIVQRNSDAVLDNRGAVIVRCYPYRSATYMHLVYNLIYATLASNTHFGTAQSPDEIRPILLNYNSGTNAQQSQSNPSVVVPSNSGTFVGGSVLNFGGQQQQQWTDFVLIRVHFSSHEPALYFMQLFNRSVCRVFDRRQVRAPFCHSDLTRPERVLRNHLLQICDSKNNSAVRAAHQQQYNRGRFFSCTPRFYHNGFQMFKECPNGRIELVPWDQFSEGQYLHVLVASLRKYSAMYKQKECFVIIQNVAQHTGSSEEDTERITGVVYSIVSTEAYRQRCIHIKQKFELYKNTALTKSATTAGAPPFSQANIYLPQRIERLPRRGGGGVTRDSAHGEDQKLKEEGKMRQQQQQATEKQKAQDNAGEEKQKRSTRPPLIRVQFRAREAAIAFSQIFKEQQVCLRQKRLDIGGQSEENGDAVVEEQSDGGGQGEEINPQSSFLHSELADGGGDIHGPQSLDTLIITAFAHRDLTPPELALGYALRQYCREQNGIANTRVYLYPRSGRIFERNDR